MIEDTLSTSKLRAAIHNLHIKIRQVVSDSIYSGALDGEARSSSISGPSRYADSYPESATSRPTSLSHRPYHTGLKCEVARVPSFLTRLDNCGAILFGRSNVAYKT